MILAPGQPTRCSRSSPPPSQGGRASTVTPSSLLQVVGGTTEQMQCILANSQLRAATYTCLAVLTHIAQLCETQSTALQVFLQRSATASPPPLAASRLLRAVLPQLGLISSIWEVAHKEAGTVYTTLIGITLPPFDAPQAWLQSVPYWINVFL